MSLCCDFLLILVVSLVTSLLLTRATSPIKSEDMKTAASLYDLACVDYCHAGLGMSTGTRSEQNIGTRGDGDHFISGGSGLDKTTAGEGFLCRERYDNASVSQGAVTYVDDRQQS